MVTCVDALAEMQVRPLADQREVHLWREIVVPYHNPGYASLLDARRRYLVTSERYVHDGRTTEQILEHAPRNHHSPQ